MRGDFVSVYEFVDIGWTNQAASQSVFAVSVTEQEAYFTSLNLVLVQSYSAKEAFGTLK